MAFEIQKLNGVEQQYSMHEKEMIAVASTLSATVAALPSRWDFYNGN